MQTADVAMILFTGEAKREAYREIQQSCQPHRRLPGEAGAGDQGCHSMYGSALTVSLQ